jgi:anthranilate phosphoribosyltransferase
MLKRVIEKVSLRESLTEEEAFQAMIVIMEGGVSPAQIAAYITALRMKGETVEEIAGSAKAMRAKALSLGQPFDQSLPLLDTAGTGGDGSQTFNISTTVAFVAAGAGLWVAKHGNRSVSSRCGSADLLSALGVKIAASPVMVRRCLQTIGIGFLFAPTFHTAMKHAVVPRQEIGIRTIFNLLGPVTNPAGANVQIMGVFNPELTEPLAQVLRSLGTKSALVVHGEGSYDEITTTGETKVSQLLGKQVKTYRIKPEDVGLRRANPEELQGGDAQHNADITLRILGGERGPKRDVVLLNSAAALMAAGKAGSLKQGMELAGHSIDSGNALRKLKQLVSLTNTDGGDGSND